MCMGVFLHICCVLHMEGAPGSQKKKRCGSPITEVTDGYEP